MDSIVAAPSLATALSRAIVDPQQWQTALEVLCQTCGASKALISRRSHQGAEIIIPTRVQDEWQSPLIHAFSLEEVEDFLVNYQEADPWTKIEAQNHPYTPYAMSRYFPVSRLRKNPFWNWLEPQGIVDCVIAELAHDGDGWTALNLYLDANQAQDPDLVIARLKMVLPDVSSMWTAGKELFLARSDLRPVPSIVEMMSDPCLVVDLESRLVACNQAARSLAQQEVINAIPGEPLRLPRHWAQHLGPGTTQLATLNDPPQVMDWRPSVVEDLRIEHVSGELAGHHIIILLQNKDADSDRPDWEHPALNERERVLVKLIAHGGKVRDGAEIFGISVRANANIMKSASVKLGGVKKQDLPIRNEKFLKDEER